MIDVEVLARLACDSLRAFSSGPPQVIASLLKLLLKLSQDAEKRSLELSALDGLAELLLNVIDVVDDVALRRTAAELFVRSVGRRELPVALHGGRVGRPPRLPRAFEAWQGDAAPQRTLDAKSCAAALKRRLEAWKARPTRALEARREPLLFTSLLK